MESVWNEGDDQIRAANLFIESGLVGDIKGDGSSIFETFAKTLGRRQGSACYVSLSVPARPMRRSRLTDGHFYARISKNLDSGLGDEAGA